MKPEQCETLFRKTAQLLQKHGLSWVVEEVREFVSQGRPIEKDIMVEPPDIPDGKRRRKRQVTFMASEPYTPCEQREFLLQAVDHAVVDTVEMEEHTLNALTLEESTPTTVVCAPDTSVEEEDTNTEPALEPTGAEFRLSVDSTRDRLASAKELRKALSEVISEAHNNAE